MLQRKNETIILVSLQHNQTIGVQHDKRSTVVLRAPSLLIKDVGVGHIAFIICKS